MSAKRFVLLLCTYICQKSNASNAVIPYIPAVIFLSNGNQSTVADTTHHGDENSWFYYYVHLEKTHWKINGCFVRC